MSVKDRKIDNYTYPKNKRLCKIILKHIRILENQVYRIDWKKKEKKLKQFRENSYIQDFKSPMTSTVFFK